MRIIDLFSGAGGLTFGFYYKKRGTRFVRNKQNTFVFANEYDRNAAEAFKKNYPDVKMVNKDIKAIGEREIRELMGAEPVDVIIGGPPCQSFSTVGQRIYDEKALLYEEYARILGIVRPKVFLFENVKGLLSMKEVIYKRDENGEILYEYTENRETGKKRKKPIVEKYGQKLIDIIKQKFERINCDTGYTIYINVLNAVDYGVPENRERVFIVGVRNDLSVSWASPTRKVSKLSVKDAISDLPPVVEGQSCDTYLDEPKNEYQLLMRKDAKVLLNHSCGVYGEKIRTVIKNVKQGQGKNEFNSLVEKGAVDSKYRLTSGYANTYGRLIENQPCTTITNNLSTPSGLRCIHYEQDRALTPREGARIQSFPDWFQFVGCREQITTQIGNAVPPLLSLSLADSIDRMLKGILPHGD